MLMVCLKLNRLLEASELEVCPLLCHK
jgi:hypothetical protein